MRIGILTFHRSINYGAVMQCYSLVTELKKRFPNDEIEVIDYVPQFRLDNYKPSVFRIVINGIKKQNTVLMNTKIIASKVIRLLKDRQYLRNLKIRFAAFERSMRFLPLSEEKYRQNDAEAFRKAVCGKYDVIISGSDCVWEWTTVPLPSAYYLIGDFKAVKMSYAASAGTDDYKKLSLDNQNMLKSAISDFAYVGVRDTSTEYVVKNVCPEAEIHHNCDPTTFFDAETLSATKQKMKELLCARGIDFSKPIIGVMANEELGKAARTIFGSDAQYVGLYAHNRYCDINLPELNVLEWASVFGLFNITVTTFFHGTMLSLVNNTPVISVDYLPETPQQHTKLHELYDRLKLSGFYWRRNDIYDSSRMEEIKKSANEIMLHLPKEQIRAALKKEAESCGSFFDFLEKLHEGDA